MKNLIALSLFLVACNVVPAVDQTPYVTAPQECSVNLTECSCDQLPEDDYVGRVTYESNRCISEMEAITSCNKPTCAKGIAWARICYCE